MPTNDNVRKGFIENEGYTLLLAALPEYLRPVVTMAYQEPHPSRRARAGGHANQRPQNAFNIIDESDLKLAVRKQHWVFVEWNCLAGQLSYM
jgi:hypothetical protein